VIEVIDLTKYYGDRKILHSLSFSVGAKRVCGFLGPNGSGKSTTMDILAGLLGPSSGTAKVCGFDVVTQTRDVKSCVGYLPDNPPLHKEMNVLEFVTYVAKLRGIYSEKSKTHVESIIEECDVADVKKRLIGNLSKGYRQRVALCAALVHKPQVLILDEPTEGLDPNQIVHIRNLIKKLASERTVIMSSHILSEIQATCDEVVIINHGHIATKLALDEVKFKRTYFYTFLSNIDETFNWFNQNSVVESAKLDPKNKNRICITYKTEFLNTESYKENLWKMNQEIISKNFPLIGIEEKKDAIEDIFFDVIRSQPNAVI
jgi:ABC-2 type transport system ATP-binding protein